MAFPQQITVCYRKIIDATATRPWEKLVLEDSYRELRMQAQRFNPEKRYRTYAELRQHVPGSEQLPFLVSGAVRGYVQQLGGVVPDVLNNLGQRFLTFQNFQFELINSDLLDPARHQVALNFYADPLYWHATIGEYLLVSAAAAGEVPTQLFRLPAFVSISTLHLPTS